MRIVSVATYIYKGNFILIGKRGYSAPTGSGLFNVPMGYIDYKEKPEESAIREIKEETGLNIPMNSLINGGIEQWAPDKAGINFIVNLPKAFNQEIGNGDGENSKFIWADINEIGNYRFAFGQEKHIIEFFKKYCNNMLNEKSKSKAQQRFFGMVHAYQKGELDNASQSIKDVADSMSKKEVKKFAETKHNGLPNHVKKDKKNVNEGNVHDETIKTMADYIIGKADTKKANKAIMNLASLKENFNENKKTIKINESQLRNIIKQVLRESINDVTYNEIFETPSGIEFILLPSNEINKMDGYDAVVAKTHIDNVGCIIVDPEYYSAIDDEYELDEIYEMIENGECK